MMDRTNNKLARLASEIAAAPYISGVALLAKTTGLALLLFPEMGALSYDILKRPYGTWARAPLMLALTPFLTAIVGTVLTRELAYGPVSVMLAIGSAMLIIRVLRSPIAPALAAGLLPLTLGETDWRYPLCVLASTGLLAAIAALRTRHLPPPHQPITHDDEIDDELEETPAHYGWAPWFLAFLGLTLVAAQLTGWRFVLFPPLVVMGFEMFAHAEVCPWAKQPLRLPVAAVLTACAGLLAVHWLGTGVLAAGLSVLAGITILDVMKLHVPPAIAVALLPLVIDNAGWELPVAVGLGTALLTSSFLLWQWLVRRSRRAPAQV